MPIVLPRDRLKRIAQAECRVIASWKEGVSLERDSGRQIQQLLCMVAADRWWLAQAHRGHANKLLGARPALYRSAVSRYYYSMYHAMRACVFIFHQGDDHQEHSALPLKIPIDFDPATDWQNKLKNARLARNRADYEAYPKADKSWRKAAFSMKGDADLLIATARQYLKIKGCVL